MIEHSKICLTCGVGRHREKLQSFELALRDAGIAEYNLVRVSSIFPPNVELVRKDTMKASLKPGQVVFCVMSDNATNESSRLVACSVGLAMPADKSKHGYLSEFHGFGVTDAEAGEYSEDLAAEMVATILGVPFDAEKSWNERKGTWKLNKDVFKTKNISQSAFGKRNNWTTVVSAAILIP